MFDRKKSRQNPHFVRLNLHWSRFFCGYHMIIPTVVLAEDNPLVFWRIAVTLPQHASTIWPNIIHYTYIYIPPLFCVFIPPSFATIHPSHFPAMCHDQAALVCFPTLVGVVIGIPCKLSIWCVFLPCPTLEHQLQLGKPPVQWSFQDPIDWRYQPYIRPIFEALISGNIPPKYGQTYGTNVPPF